MKLFPQLALVSAIAISGNAMAMQALDDESLSAATGQDGITILIKPPTSNFDALTGTSYFAATGGFADVISIDNIYIHDKDGANDNAIVPTADSEAGAIVLDGFAIAGSAPIEVVIDADSNAGDPLLNVNVKLPQTLVIRTGEISVASSNRVIGTAITNTSLRGIAADQNKILNSIDIELGGASLNIQLGAEAQGAMIKLAGEVAGGITITGVELFDNAGVAATAAVAADPLATPPIAAAARTLGTAGGSIYIGAINIRDTGDTKLTLESDIDVSANGLILTSTSAIKTDIFLADVRLGNVAATPALGNSDTTLSIGDIEVVGMNMTGTQIAISGH